MAEPQKRKNGRWRIQWKDTTGKRRSEHYKTHDAARSALRRRETHVEDIRAGRSRPHADSTIAEVAPVWLASRAPQPGDTDVARRARKKQRHASNKYHLDMHIVPKLGPLRLPQVTDEVMRQFIAELEGTRTNRNPNGKRREVNAEGRTLRPSTIRNIVTTLRKMLRDVGYHVRASVKVTTNAYAWIKEGADVARFLDACDGWFKVAAALSLYGGLRKGEIASLRWADVDFEREVLVLDRSWETATKGNEVRTAPLPKELATLLKGWRKATQGKGGGLVVHRDGRPLHRGVDLAAFTRRACVAAGVDPVHFHALRHTWASHASDNGLPVARLQAVLGHKSITTTQRYVHVAADVAARDPRAQLSFGR